jgi:hypothetical protein
MPDSDEVFVGGFGIKMSGGAPYSLFGVADENGWQGFISRENDKRPLPGLSIRDNELIIRATWVDLGGIREFRWRAFSTLIEQVAGRPQPLNTAADRIPNMGSARFPTNE